MKLETILTPAELPTLALQTKAKTACVVFDILRATSTFITALHNGAERIIPVSTISEAVAWRKKAANILLAGERDGLRISAAQSSGTDFDFGNSPREFSAERVLGKTIVSTTTNGTRALQACKNAEVVLAAAFLNLTATADFLIAKKFDVVQLVCAGTGESVALEDVLAAGALLAKLHSLGNIELSDASHIALKTFLEMKTDLATALGASQNGRRLLTNPDLRADVAICAKIDVANFTVMMDADGALRRL